MTELTLDGTLGMEAIHALLAETLQFPDFYGRNLDALYDCLLELRQDTGFRLVALHALGRRGQALRLLLEQAAQHNPHIQIL